MAHSAGSAQANDECTADELLDFLTEPCAKCGGQQHVCVPAALGGSPEYVAGYTPLPEGGFVCPECAGKPDSLTGMMGRASAEVSADGHKRPKMRTSQEEGDEGV